MHPVKDSPRSLVRVGYDGRVHKTFRGPRAKQRFDNEVRVLRHLETRGCDFVPQVLEADETNLYLVTSNCGKPVDQLNVDKQRELFDRLRGYGVCHGDEELRNITYRISDQRFCVIDFELARLDGDPPPAPENTKDEQERERQLRRLPASRPRRHP